MHIGNAWESKMAATRRRKSKWDVPSSENDSSSSNANLSATDAAKERAAKLNAMLAAQGKLAKGTPPPFVGQPSPVAKATATPSQALNNGNKNLNQDLITAEVEINDSPARNFLCRGTTQDDINRYSGAAVSTRGKFMNDLEKKEAEGTGVKPLYLCIQGLTQEKVDLAVKRVMEIMNGAPVVDINSSQSSQPGMPQPPRMPVPAPMPTHALNQTLAIFDRQPLPPGMHYVQEKVFVGLDNALPEFIVKDKLQGPGQVDPWYLLLNIILGDPGADSGDEGKSKWTEKYGMKKSKEWREEPLGTMSYQTSSKRSPFSGTNQKSERQRLFATGLGSYFQHICTQTGAKVQLRGRGSGFIEPTSGKEAFEALYIYISHSKVDGLAAAKKLVENLIETVHTEYKAFEQTRRSHYGYSPYMNVGNPPAQPPSGYQPPPYGYQHPPPHGNGYPQPVQPPPVPGYMYNHPPHAPLHQPVPPHAIPPRYGPPPPPGAGYPNQLPPNMGPPPPRGPEPYHGYPPGPHHQGAPPPGPLPIGPHQEGLKEALPLAPHMRPPRETERQSQDQGPAASHQEHSQRGNGPPQSQDPPRRKFKEKIPFKASTQDYKTVEAGPKYQESSILNPSLGEGHRRSSAESMPPPPALEPSLKTRPKQSEFAAPLPPKDAMPPPIAPVRSRVPAGKREAATFSQPAPVATKKQKTEDSAAMKSSAIASLVAYGEEDSSDEEGSTSPEHKQVTPQKREEDKSRQGARLPFWAVRR